MSIRREVEDLIALGPLPDTSADEEVIAPHQVRLQKINRPVSQEEAVLLIRLFGPDDCYGLAWTLLHLIESAPGGVPLWAKPSASDNEWLHRLWERSHR
jgi:hypothetical protein